ncbi:MAG TPA: alpha/beta hydrolase [Kribbella sp.]|uniref:alpha/beta fold hydrolase n=1 Tax=Kribbella sp. TaxID=1871183 RepID=UPI002D771748|nr:alpha/beta hydrolase [Kribbella sp.]HET6296284.1 alpha/beta hydrolase [Kribbella sp.]
MISLVDDLPVYYEAVGAGRPLVFLPGWGNANGEAQEVHEPVFAGHPGWRRIYLDPPGTGRTPARDWIKDQDGMLAVIARVIGDVVGDERYAVAGTSAGGLHARGLVHRDPAQVLGLLLRVPGIVVDRAKRTLPEYAPWIADERFATDEDPRPLVQTAEYLEAHRDKQKRFYLPAEEQADLEFLGKIQRDGYALSFDPATRLEAPTLIVTGRQDTMTGYADAWPLLDDYPRATYAVLDRSDHDLPVQNHALYRALVDDWLTRVEEFAAA